jgi:hypothetical protein
MADSLPRLLVIMGSGETSPTMSKLHLELFERLGPAPVPAVVLDTPFGFQGNADDLAARAVEYFHQSVGRDLAVASYRSAEEIGTLEHEAMLNRLRAARYVFAGPGSPSYALRQWRGTQVPVVLAEKLRSGGCVTFASAAAATLGVAALPVYEVYKVGQAPHWLDGLDLLADVGLRAAVIPHFDNAEGGTHDTRYCYMGERRLSLLEEMLPADTFLLGVDEHTACVLDLDAGTATVSGRGALTVRRSGRVARVAAGEAVAITALPGLADDGVSPAAAHGREMPAAGAVGQTAAVPAHQGSPLLAEVARLESDFSAALEARDARAAVKATLALDDLIVDWSRDTLQSDELDRARAALRSMVVRLGDAAELGVADPRDAVAPFVDALLAARTQARADGRWRDADVLRDRLVAEGVEVRDTPGGTVWDLKG